MLITPDLEGEKSLPVKKSSHCRAEEEFSGSVKKTWSHNIFRYSFGWYSYNSVWYFPDWNTLPEAPFPMLAELISQFHHGTFVMRKLLSIT